MTPGALARMIWDRLRYPPSRWGEECAHGEPVPEDEGCRTFHCPTVRMTELGPGRKGLVSCLEAPSDAGARKLAALGLLPGTDLEVLQTSPVWVLRSGYTEIALDRELAQHVRVHPTA
jgi:Fe2+ transport system protein FeoA